MADNSPEKKDYHTQMVKKFETVKWQKHPCGAGSVFENTDKIRKLLAKIVEEFDIHSIADIGAGDLSWIHATEWPHEVKYKAYDLVPRHPDVIKHDITSETFPTVDLIICRYVLNHFDHRLLHDSAIENMKKSNSKYLLMTLTPRKEDMYNEIWGSSSLIPLLREGLNGRHDWHYGLWKL